MRRIDLLVLLRPGEGLDARVDRGIDTQTGVRLIRHVVVGTRAEAAENRWETIARARNQAKRLGQSPWVMFLDDDVVLAPSCARRLGEALDQRADCGALAADYLGEGGDLRAEHVAMGATLFRREALEQIDFRWEPGRCECQCCCDDLRRLGWTIGYWPRAYAAHLDRRRCLDFPAVVAASESVDAIEPTDRPRTAPNTGRILVAFDERHYDKFAWQFLRSLRAQGNREVVTVVAYGLSPLQVTWLRRLNGVEVITRPHDGRAVPVRRIEDFQHVIEKWDPETSVAYWDAGDVIVQSALDKLWVLVRTHPDKILAVREPLAHPENRAVETWTTSIRDPSARRRAYKLMTSRPFLNSGFVAGTARSLLQYFQEAEMLRKSPALLGTSDWGDQTALNLYCHSHPERWQEIDEVWNYCLYARKKGDVRVDSLGRAIRHDGAVISAVHGTANTLRFHRFRHRLP